MKRNKYIVLFFGTTATLLTLACERHNGQTVSGSVRKSRTAESSSLSAGETPAALYRLEPLDLSTGVDGKKFEIAIRHWQGLSPEYVIKEIEANLTFFTWPGKEIVEFKTNRSKSKKGSPETIIEIIPKNNLPEGWYAIGVSGDMRFSRPAPHYFIENNGINISRFRIGSRPFIRAITSTVKADGKSFLDYEFSEGIVFSSQPKNASSMEIPFGGVDCAVLDVHLNYSINRIRKICRDMKAPSYSADFLVEAEYGLSGGKKIGKSKVIMKSQNFTDVASKTVTTEPLVWD